MENKNEGNKEEPLLYIHQPKFQKPGRKMQDHYLSEDLTEDLQLDGIILQDGNKKQLFTLPPLDSEKIIEVIQDNVDEKQEGQQEGQREEQQEEQEVEKKRISAADYFRRNPSTSKRKNWNFTPVQPFKDMSIKEKLQYLSGFPSSQQPYPCEFITENQRYSGTLSKYENDLIIVKNLQGDNDEVNVKDIQAIRIKI